MALALGSVKSQGQFRPMETGKESSHFVDSQPYNTSKCLTETVSKRHISSINCIILLNPQFRERFKRRLNVIFPAVNDPNPARKSSRVKPSVVGTVQIIEVQPYSGVSEMKEQ